MKENQNIKNPGSTSSSQAVSLVRSLKEVLKEFEVRESRGVEDVLGHPFTQWPILNDELSGLKPGTLTLVGSWKGYHRKEFMMEWCSGVTQRSRIPSLFVSFERPSRELVFRRIARESNLPYSIVATRKMLGDPVRKEKLQAGLQQMASYQGLLHLSPGLEQPNVGALENEIRRIGGGPSGRYPIVFIDWLNVMEVEGVQEEESRICALARQLKVLAVKYGIPVVAGVDFNKSAQEVRGDAPAQETYIEQMAGGSQIWQQADDCFTLSSSGVDSEELNRLLENLGREKGVDEGVVPAADIFFLESRSGLEASAYFSGILFLVALDTGLCVEICSGTEQEIVRFNRLEKRVQALEEKGVWNFPDHLTQGPVSVETSTQPTEEKEKIKVSVKLT